jgi:hypothetical protein
LLIHHHHHVLASSPEDPHSLPFRPSLCFPRLRLPRPASPRRNRTRCRQSDQCCQALLPFLLFSCLAHLLERSTSRTVRRRILALAMLIPTIFSPTASAPSTARVRVPMRLPSQSGLTAGVRITFPPNRPISASARKTALVIPTTSVATRMQASTSTSKWLATNHLVLQAVTPHHLQQM